MSLQFILGSSGAGKSHYIFEQIIEESMHNRNQNYIILVPDQFTMQTQKDMVQMHPNKGILNIDVLSFSRLAYRVFEEVGGYQEVVLEETGKSLVLQKIAQEKKSELKILGANLRKAGYISEMKSLISEFMQYQIDENELEEIYAQSTKRVQLQQKLQDVKVVYKGFREYLQDRFITTEEVLDILCDTIRKSEMVKHSVLVLDGFTGFTPIQLKVIKELLVMCDKVYVTLTLDRREDPMKLGGKHQLFAMSKRTIHAICKMSKEVHAIVEEPRWIEVGKKSRFVPESAIGFLEHHLFRYGNQVYEKEQDEISIKLAKNPLLEVQELVMTINRLVREEGYRYKEIAIVSGDIDTYKDYLVSSFAACRIPYFMDEKHSVLMNPLVEYIRAAMDVVLQSYSYESVFRYLRCGMSGVEVEEIDELENYVIALGIRGFQKWKETWVRSYKKMEKERLLVLNEIREKVITELEEFTNALLNKDSTIRMWTTALYEFLVRGQVQVKLKKQEKEFEQNGQKAYVKEYAQIYGIVLNLFDKLVEVLGEERVPLAEYKAIMDAGLEEAKVGIIPPSADQVMVGDIERTRLKDIKALFFIGVNDTNIPKRATSGGILSELDRDYLEELNVELAPTARENMYIQKCYLYLNLTKPSKYLFLSYSKASASGESIGPAYLINMMHKMYPKMGVYEIPDVHIEEDILKSNLERAETSVEYLIEGLRQANRVQPNDTWKELYTWFVTQEAYAPKVKKLLEAAFYQNTEDQISQAVAKALYGEVLENSASRLEKFAGCAFAHFLQYGLRLSERVEYEFNAMDLGNVAHKALEWFSNRLEERQDTWKTISPQERDALIEECVEEVVHDYGNTILHSSARSEYMIQRVKRILRRTVWAIQAQIAKGEFEPKSFEVDFSRIEDLQTVAIALSDTQKMKLRGRIDRVDTYEDKEHIYVKVIDYKTGSKNFDLVAVYHGLQLQLLVYMNAALEMEQKQNPNKQVEPAGVFYFRIQDPVIDGNYETTEEEIRETLLKELCVNGIIQEDSMILEKMDETLSAENIQKGLAKSKVVPVEYTKTGKLSRASKTISKEQFQVLSSFVNKKVKCIGKEIIEGNVTINPYKKKTECACDYCQFHAICGFDEKVPGYAYRKLKGFDSEEIWSAFLEEGK